MLSGTDVVVPNLFYVSKDQQGIIQEKHVAGVPEFIIEIFSTNRNSDLVLKRNLYERHGVQEYWIVDPDAGEVLCHTLHEGSYLTPEQYSDCVESHVLPGFKLLVAEIFQSTQD